LSFLSFTLYAGATRRLLPGCPQCSGPPGFPPIKHNKACVIVEELCVKVIDEVKGAEDVQTHCHTDNGTSDFM